MTLQLKTVYKTHYNKGNENTKKKNRKKTPKRKPKHTVDKNFGIELKNSIKAKKKSNLNLLCISSLWQNLPKTTSDT